MRFNRTMNLILLTSSYPSSLDVVSKNFLTDLAETLTAKKIHVFVICPHQPTLPFKEEKKGITIIRFPYWFTTSGERLGGSGGMTSTVFRSPVTVFQLIPFCICQFLKTVEIIKREKIDLIHSHWIIPQGLIGAIISFFMNIPHISSIHGSDIHLVHSYRIFHPLIRFVSKCSDYVTTNSSYTAQLFLNVVHSNQNNRIIPMGIKIDEYKLRSKAVNQTKITVLFVGRLIPIKGVQYLIKSMKIVVQTNPRTQLVIIGDGPCRNELIELTNKLDLASEIHFLGNQERNTLLSFYKEADIFVLPSITHLNQSEGLGVVLLEAMASGIPVIGSNTGGIPDIINDHINGLLVPPGDPKALAEAIIHLVNNPEITSKFQTTGLQTVKERFTWDTIADMFIELYETSIMEEHNDDRQ